MKFRSRPPRFTRFPVLLLITLAALAIFTGEAAAVTDNEGLVRVGPVNPTPSVGNFPAWYQDNTGITLEFCDPKNAAEAAGAYCLVGTAEVPNPPEVFPGEFFDEHFYYSITAVFPANPLKALLWESAVEAAFATGGAAPGAQIVFTRIRIRLEDVPVTGTYTFIHPYGVIFADGVAGDRIFVTQDVGVQEGVFTGALGSTVGPFLLPADAPGGNELAPETGPLGQLYLARAAGPITGSPFDNNFVRVIGPTPNTFGTGVDNIATTNFTVVGRLFSGTIPGDVSVERAEYTRNGAGEKVEVYATGIMTTPKRLPAQGPPTPFRPQLSFFHDNCVIGPDGYTNIAPSAVDNSHMFNADNNFWGQAPITPIPSLVCVEDDVSNAGFPMAVGDAINISEAYYDPIAQSLSVKARSGDEIANPLPTLTLEGIGDLTDGSILVSTPAPPAYAYVLSSAGGSNAFQVTTTPPPSLTAAASVTLSASPVGSAFPGDNVVFTALASPNGGIYEYEFWLYKYATEGPWTVVQPYSTLPSWAWNTNVEGGPYGVAVYARALGSGVTSGPIDSQVYNLIRPPVDNVTLTPSDNTPHTYGTPVTFTAAADGGTGEYEYEFWFYNYQTEGPWGVVQPFSSDPTWETPALLVPGSYNVAVYARSAGSTAPSEQIASMVYVIQQ